MSGVRDVRRRWQQLPVVVRDLPPALLLLLASLVPALRTYGTQVGDLPARPLDGLAVVALLLETLPLAVRRRYPRLSLGLVVAGFALDQLRAYHLVAGAALALALMSAGTHVERRRRATIVVLTGAYVALAVALRALGSPEGTTGFVTFYLLGVLAWGTGAWLRSVRAGELARRRRAAGAAREAERTRLAADLHDVVTHHVTAMVVQAEAARYLTAAPERLDATLGAIADTGRSAITDLRRLLVLLDPGDPPPGGHDVGVLVEQVRRAGQPVELIVEGEGGTMSDDAGLVAYRVVQEALTNAVKHAPGARTVVRVRRDERGIDVEVGDDGGGAGGGGAGPVVVAPLPGSGRGLAGLRERVEARGGQFAASARPGGGFTVRAHIPAARP